MSLDSETLVHPVYAGAVGGIGGDQNSVRFADVLSTRMAIARGHAAEVAARRDTNTPRGRA